MLWNKDNNELPSHIAMDMDLRLMRMGTAAVINRHFLNGETTCHLLSKRLPNNSTIFAAEATAITLALDYYGYMDPVKHDVVVYSDSMSCLQAIEGEDIEIQYPKDDIQNLTKCCGIDCSSSQDQ